MSLPTPDELRRGWCPGTLRPMETGDGWLVRLYPPAGTMTPDDLAVVAALATRHGNDQIEVSGRGNLQLRGVTAETHPALVEALLAASLVDESPGDGPSRLVLASPLAGWAADDHLDAAALARETEAAGRAVAGLPAKISVVVDGGGACTLDAFACDLRLRALAPDAVAIGLADTHWYGPVAPADAPRLATALLDAFAERHRHAPERPRRMRDLDAAALATLASTQGLAAIPAPAPRAAPIRAGSVALAEGYAILAALPFGRGDAALLARIAAMARTCGVSAIRPTPWRGLVFRTDDATRADALGTALSAAGLILGDDDPRLSVAACPGAPACSRGETASMADAARLAAVLADRLSAGLSLHVSACIKACAHPGPADLTLRGRDGLYDVILGGGTRDHAIARLSMEELVRRLEPGQDIAARLDERAGQARHLQAGHPVEHA